MIARYLIILLIGLGLPLLYIILTPLTIYPSSFLLRLFYPIIVQGNEIIIGDAIITLISACLAASAFYLLILLNISIPMNTRNRIYSLSFSLLLFLGINILRIAIFSILFINSFQYFDFTHKLFWYFLSGVLVFLVWIATIKLFKIKGIPFYTDIRFLYQKN